ncbi:MAG: Hsp20/alpha crystallin family protein [Thermaurantiacus sp.]
MDLRSLIPFGRGNLPAGQPVADPFAQMRREIDRMFEDVSRGFGLPPVATAFSGNAFLSPRVDVSETDDGLDLKAELPGVPEENVHLELADNVLTLKAEHRTEREEKDEKRTWHLVERAEGSFLRRLQLPFEADAEHVKADFRDGVLSVHVPRKRVPEKEPKRIAIGRG